MKTLLMAILIGLTVAACGGSDYCDCGNQPDAADFDGEITSIDHEYANHCIGDYDGYCEIAVYVIDKSSIQIYVCKPDLICPEDSIRGWVKYGE